MYVDQMNYWNNLVEYYYDNVHWRDSDIAPTNSLANWIKKEFSGTVDYERKKIHFDDPKHLSWFVLKWS